MPMTAFTPRKAVNWESVKEHQVGSMPAFIHGDKVEKTVDRRRIYGYSYAKSDKKHERLEEEEEEEEEISSQSSSIGVLSSLSYSADEEERGDEAQSTLKEGRPLASVTSLEESLPIKRGLSIFFSGKSKSFASVADASSACNASVLAKQENPFNKRRRIIMSCKASWRRRRGSCTSFMASFSPLLSTDYVKEEDEEHDEDYVDEDDDDDDNDERERVVFPLYPHHRLRKCLKNPRSHSLSDLQL